MILVEGLRITIRDKVIYERPYVTADSHSPEEYDFRGFYWNLDGCIAVEVATIAEYFLDEMMEIGEVASGEDIIDLAFDLIAEKHWALEDIPIRGYTMDQYFDRMRLLRHRFG